MKNIIKRYTPRMLLDIFYTVYKALIYRTTPKNKFPAINLESLPCLVAYNKFGGYCVPLDSIQRPCSQATLRGVVWEEETLEFLRSSCAGGDIVHAGTYFGDFLPGLSKSCGENSLIWAFEPNSQNFRCAKITCQINNLENVNLLNAGLGESKLAGLMNVIDEKGRNKGGSSTIIERDKDLDDAKTEIVEIVSLDSVIPEERHIALLQLDIEGYEKKALLGGMSLIKRCSPIIVLENPVPDVSWLEEHIFALGYKVQGEVQGNTIFIN